MLVWRLDRWGRSVTDLLATLQELEYLGVGFISLTEALDLTTPAGRAMAGLLAIFAAFEKDILRERTKAGLAHARQNGKQLGRPLTAGLQAARFGSYIAPMSASLRSPVVCRSAARQSGVSSEKGSDHEQSVYRVPQDLDRPMRSHRRHPRPLRRRKRAGLI